MEQWPVDTHIDRVATEEELGQLFEQMKEMPARVQKSSALRYFGLTSGKAKQEIHYGERGKEKTLNG